MSTRRDNRIAAFQFLYMWDINPPEDLEIELKQFFDDQKNPREFYNFAEENRRNKTAKQPVQFVPREG